MFSVESSEDAYNLQLAIVNLKVTTGCCQDDLRCCFLTGVSAGGSSATIPLSPLLRPTIIVYAHEQRQYDVINSTH